MTTQSRGVGPILVYAVTAAEVLCALMTVVFAMEHLLIYLNIGGVVHRARRAVADLQFGDLECRDKPYSKRSEGLCGAGLAGLEMRLHIMWVG